MSNQVEERAALDHPDQMTIDAYIAEVDLLRRADGDVQMVNLPDRGILGNSHILMVDRNNLQVVQDWLAGRDSRSISSKKMVDSWWSSGPYR